MAPLNWVLLLLALLPIAAVADLWAKYVRSPESITVPKDDEVAFKCQTNIKVEKIVWWHRKLFSYDSVPPKWTEISIANLTEHSFSSPYRILTKPISSKLTIINVTDESLAGEYRCVSWNGASALASVPGKLNIAWLGPPPRVQNEQLIVAPGSKLFLRCPPPKSEPPPLMIYYHMVRGHGHLMDSIRGTDGFLANTSKVNTTQIYTCEAKNPINEAIVVYDHRITIIVKDHLPQKPNFISFMPTEIIGKEGESVSLPCSVIGFPAPKITWKRRNGSLPHSSESIAPFLYINRLQIRDEGEYICIAHNSAGKSEKVIKLYVQYAPKFDGDHYDKEEIVHEGESVRFSCSHIIGNPKPHLYWLINGADVSNDSSIRIRDNNNLEIQPVQKRHAGLIQCFGSNVHGNIYIGDLLKVFPKQFITQDASDNIHLESKRPRGNGRGNKPAGGRQTKGKHLLTPPSRPKVTRLSDESVMVRWNVNKTGLPIIFFKVQYRDLNSTEKNQNRDSRWNTLDQTIPAVVHSYEVGGLTAGHYYLFRIAAVYSNDDNNQGPNSAKFLLQHGIDLHKAPPTPKLNRTEAVSVTAIRIHWELENIMEAFMDSPKIEGFYVYYRPTSTVGDYLKKAVEGAETRTHTLTSLVPGAQYEIKLQSFTKSVPSKFSNIMYQGTLKPLIEKPNEMNSATNLESGLGSAGNADNKMELNVVILASVAGGLVCVIFLVTILLLLVRKKRGDKPGAASSNSGRNSTTIEGLNGYLSSPPAYSKTTMTITPNPLHPENENLEMLTAQNNNCSTTSPRASIELSASIPSSCREESRKHSPMPIPARENYV